MQRIGAYDLIQPADFRQHGFGQAAINLDKGNRLTACVPSPKMKGRNSDSMPTAKAAKITNKARLVIIAKIKKMWRKI